jgi:hypothetical protein
LAALSVIVTDAEREPVAEGLNVTLIVQIEPAATPLPQVSVCVKSPLFAPVTAMDVIERGALPPFVRVIAWAALEVPTTWLLNVSEVGDSVADVVPAAPVPVRLTVCGELAALSVMVTEALRVPDAAGVKVTSIVQLLPAATLVPQLLV